MKPEEKIHRRVVAELRRTFMRRGYERGTEPCFHCPNESQVPAKYRAKLAALGLSCGVPDLIVVNPIVLEGKVYPGLALELKSDKGRASADQIRWLGVWQAAGFYAAVTRGMHETRDLLLACGLIDQQQALRFDA
jgi:hypothetical protein